MLDFRWHLCGCARPDLVRVERSFWMRLWPERRLYQCGRCGRLQLLTRNAVVAARGDHFRPDPRPHPSRR